CDALKFKFVALLWKR
ncbi:hypothetical protein KPH14_002663, partial [Odynerus spinipes]